MDRLAENVLMDFRRRRLREAWAAVLSTLAVVGGAAASTFAPEWRIGKLSDGVLAAAAAIVAYAVFHVANWRCPACRYYLGNWPMWSTPHCGACDTSFVARRVPPVLS